MTASTMGGRGACPGHAPLGLERCGKCAAWLFKAGLGGEFPPAGWGGVQDKRGRICVACGIREAEIVQGIRPAPGPALTVWEGYGAGHGDWQAGTPVSMSDPRMANANWKRGYSDGYGEGGKVASGSAAPEVIPVSAP